MKIMKPLFLLCCLAVTAFSALGFDRDRITKLTLAKNYQELHRLGNYYRDEYDFPHAYLCYRFALSSVDKENTSAQQSLFRDIAKWYNYQQRTYDEGNFRFIAGVFGNEDEACFKVSMAAKDFRNRINDANSKIRDWAYDSIVEILIWCDTVPRIKELKRDEFNLAIEQKQNIPDFDARQKRILNEKFAKRIKDALEKFNSEYGLH